MDIYFVGADTGQAVSWKNGVRTVLGKGVANGITVSGGSVYVSGTAYKNGFTTVATFWMDGTEHVLADTTTISGANTPVVSGADVYVPGFIARPAPQTYAVYWKNGQQVYLDSAAQSVAGVMALSGGDLYVAVGLGNGNNDTTTVWKNGQRLSGAPATGYFAAYTQTGSSGGTNVVENEGYFENPIPAYLQPPGSLFVTFIFQNGSDVYASGTREDKAMNIFAAYWRNGIMDSLPNYPGTYHSVATGIVVAGSDVYVVGYSDGNGSNRWGVYWKNGVEGTLSKFGQVYGVAVGN
jgi:hypothetical protein